MGFFHVYYFNVFQFSAIYEKLGKIVQDSNVLYEKRCQELAGMIKVCDFNCKANPDATAKNLDGLKLNESSMDIDVSFSGRLHIFFTILETDYRRRSHTSYKRFRVAENWKEKAGGKADCQKEEEQVQKGNFCRANINLSFFCV